MADEAVLVEEKTLNEPEKGTFEEENVKIDPWTARGHFSSKIYDKLVEQFGVQRITVELLERFERVTGHKPHRYLRRDLFFAHRDLNIILDDFEAGKPIFLYTGRGPSNSESMHLGHGISMEFIVWLQRVFNATVVFQIADDEKFWFKDVDFNTVYNMGKEIVSDLVGFGFNSEKTFVFSNHDFSRTPEYQQIAVEMLKIVKIKELKATFGIEEPI